MRIKDLAAEFPRADIHWRSQQLTKNQGKALALAYIDARHVMNRLDDVCGPENWQSKFEETPKGRVLCSIGIRVGDDWVWKSDGAGNTAVEGEKGGISDALKRAAVQWGIGRYLYALDAVWAPCEVFNGKFSKWKGSPWDSVRGGNKPPAPPPEKTQARDPRKIADSLIGAVGKCQTYDAVTGAIGAEKFDAAWKWLEENHPPLSGEVKKAVNDARNRVDPAGQAPDERAA